MIIRVSVMMQLSYLHLVKAELNIRSISDNDHHGISDDALMTLISA